MAQIGLWLAGLSLIGSVLVGGSLHWTLDARRKRLWQSQLLYIK